MKSSINLNDEDMELYLSARDLRIACHYKAVASGWWSNLETGEKLERNTGELIALVHSELSEAFEAARKDKMDDHLPNRKGLEVELADAVIRIFDMAGGLNLDIEGAIVEKMAYNQTRHDHKVSERLKAGGKKF